MGKPVCHKEESGQEVDQSSILCLKLYERAKRRDLLSASRIKFYRPEDCKYTIDILSSTDGRKGICSQ
jgi:hypothetical protein